MGSQTLTVSAGETLTLAPGYYDVTEITAEASALKAKSVSSVKTGTISYSITSSASYGNTDKRTTTKTATFSLSSLGISENDIVIVAGVVSVNQYSSFGDHSNYPAGGSYTYSIDGDTLTITATLTASEERWGEGEYRGASASLKYTIYRVVVS